MREWDISIVDTVRDAWSWEAGALEDLQRRASFVWEDYRAALRAHPHAISLTSDDISRWRVRVAVGSGDVLGFSVVVPGTPRPAYPGVVAELDGLFVEPHVMRSGVGRRLVGDACVRARGDGAAYLGVTANPRAVGFYASAGFVAAGDVDTRFGPGLRMHLDLRA